MLKGILKGLKKKKSKKLAATPTIISRENHCISRNNISNNALKVLYRLHNGGYQAFLVGGCVRDLLLHRNPKDFDIATNALPDEIKKLFKNCRLIGKRFRLAHIVFGRDIIEVATFRTHHENAEHDNHGKTHQGMIVRDNVYGDIDDDVWRRDFTINGLYYNIADFSVVDYMGGMQDIQMKTLRIIGNPDQRYQEDPVRLLRAIRFMGKLNLAISPETEEPIMRLHHLLQRVSPARLYLEVGKLFQEGAMLNTFRLLEKYQLLQELFPSLYPHIKEKNGLMLVETALMNADNRVKENKTISPAFLYAVLSWPSILYYSKEFKGSKLPAYVAHERAVHHAIRDLIERLAIPRHLSTVVKEICLLQFRFTQRYPSKAFRLLTHPRFRAAYDLLLLRAETENNIKELADWWTMFNSADEHHRDILIKECERKKLLKRKKES